MILDYSKEKEEYWSAKALKISCENDFARALMILSFGKAFNWENNPQEYINKLLKEDAINGKEAESLGIYYNIE